MRSGVAVALAFSHQLATGADFINNPRARYAWAALYIGTAAAIVWYRFVTPARQALRHSLRVVEVTSEGPDVVTVVIGGRHLSELHAASGQFFRWRFLTRDLWWVSSPYSLSAAPRPDRLRITVKALGGHSRALAAVRPGTRVVAEGPYGAMTAGARTARKGLLIAGGVGITPLRALFETVPAQRGDLTLVYRASDASDLVLRDELQAIAARRGAQLHTVLGRRRDLGHDPLSAKALNANIPDLHAHDVYVCGPPGMTESVLRVLRTAGVPRRQVHHESFEL